MIRGRLVGGRGYSRPYVTVRVMVPSQNVDDDVSFLVDTGADSTLLSPSDALYLGIDLSQLPHGDVMSGVGGTTSTVMAESTLGLGDRSFDLALRILVPNAGEPSGVLNRIPSLLGRDILAHFALFLEERTRRVLLLKPDEADRLNLP
ncbi:MAG: aspartyl protease family protein [Dehalococcoidia bacterium]